MSGSGKKGPMPAYNTPAATPTSPPYPVQQGPPMAPRGAPPAYAAAPPPGHQAYPQQPYYAGNAVPQAPVGYTQPMYGPSYPVPGAPMLVQAQPGGGMFVPGLFDAGARFEAGGQPHIPPPPPGCSPNAAQLAAMQGQQVMGTQRRGNFWVDGSGGSTTFW